MLAQLGVGRPGQRSTTALSACAFEKFDLQGTLCGLRQIIAWPGEATYL